MKPLPFIAALLISASYLQAEVPAIWPMPPSLPSMSVGVNSAAFPAPRVEWLSRVKRNFDSAAQVADKIQLVFDGDSITDSWQTAGRQIWQERYGKLGSFDFGIAADKTENLLWRLSQGQMNGIHPKLILLMIGTNNLGTNTNDQIAEGIKAIIEQYRKLCPDATILVQGIFPRAHDATNPVRSRIKEINKIISTFADGKQTLFLDFGEKFLQPDGTLSPEIMSDFLHPSAKGYQIWADAIQPVIDQQVPSTK